MTGTEKGIATDELRTDADRRVIWVDANIVDGSPSMQNLVRSRDRFFQAGIEIGLVCETCHPDLQTRVLLAIKRFPVDLLRFTAFAIAANLRLAGGKDLRKPGTIIHSTGSNAFMADLISIHFLPADWLRLIFKGGGWGFKEVVKASIYGVAGGLEFLQRVANPRAHFHVVSQGLADALVEKGVDRGNITVIPTPYDPSKYNVAVRLSQRTPARLELGFKDSSKVFAFVSQGDYRRKGLFRAIEIVDSLRRKGKDCHLMVIGGRGPELARLKAHVARAFPGSESWLHILGFVPDLIRTLSAADGFLFPSRYEGFAAVEIEAAALGLPLLLTRHPGSEMILREGENGWWINDDPAEAATKLADVYDRILPIEVPDTGMATTQEDWTRRMLELYEALLLDHRQTAGNGGRGAPHSS